MYVSSDWDFIIVCICCFIWGMVAGRYIAKFIANKLRKRKEK